MAQKSETNTFQSLCHRESQNYDYFNENHYDRVLTEKNYNETMTKSPNATANFIYFNAISSLLIVLWRKNAKKANKRCCSSRSTVAVIGWTLLGEVSEKDTKIIEYK